jgi:single-strand selective monofunctional uracil DNA glycosylase
MTSRLILSAQRLRDEIGKIAFAPPVAHVYNPLEYAWPAHEAYLRRYGQGPKRVLFLGMNPGPFGMVQTGVPFGEVEAVRDWLGIRAAVGRPASEHAKRPVTGFDCPRSEISGQRLWALFRERFHTPEAFFREHMVANYCPLAFLEPSGRNRTPDKLPAAEREALFALCDAHVREVVDVLRPEWVIGIGDFASKRAGEILAGTDVKVGRILHPSPASPLANRDWAGTATAQLVALGVWPRMPKRVL